MMSFFAYEKVEHGDPRMTDIFRLRFKIYCLECGYENACDYLEQMESDEYDAYSSHFAATEMESGRIVGTARIIHNSTSGFPILNNFEVAKEYLPEVYSGRVGEVSRLAISKEYRRRMVDKALYSVDSNVIDFLSEKERRSWRRRFEIELVTGLYHRVYQDSRELGITHLYAVMADSFYTLLSRWGLIWHEIGPAVDYHGLRRPFVASLEENLHWFEAGKKSMSL